MQDWLLLGSGTLDKMPFLRSLIRRNTAQYAAVAVLLGGVLFFVLADNPRLTADLTAEQLLCSEDLTPDLCAQPAANIPAKYRDVCESFQSSGATPDAMLDCMYRIYTESNNADHGGYKKCI